VAFAREGAKVVIAGRNHDKLAHVAAKIGEACLAVTADVSDPKDIEKLVSAAQAKFKRIDALVNNAAILLAGTAESLKEDEWDQMFSVNVRGLWLLSRAVLPTCARRAAARSLISARCSACTVRVIAWLIQRPKALCWRLRGPWRFDHAPEKIRVNCICPGIVETELVARFNLDETVPPPAAGPASHGALWPARRRGRGRSLSGQP